MEPQQPHDSIGRGRPYSGAKRGRRPRGGGPNTAAPSTRQQPASTPAYSYATLTLTPPSLQTKAQSQNQPQFQGQTHTPSQPQHQTPPTQTQTHMPMSPAPAPSAPSTATANATTSSIATSSSTTAATAITTAAATSTNTSASTNAPRSVLATTVTVPPPTPIPASYYTSQPAPPLMAPPLYIPPSSQKGKGREENSKSAASTGAVPPPAYRPPVTAGSTSAVPPTFPMRYSSYGQPVMALSPAGAHMHSQMRPPVLSTPNQAAINAAAAAAVAAATGGGTAAVAADDEDDAEDLPFMSDDVYGQGLLWQSQSKDNLKILMDNFTPEQFERYEAYRRSALPKQNVRKLIQQSTNYTVSQPVAQVMAGFAKVFVGEIVEKAREVQARWGEPSETPLSPEHLREAYRLYQQETGKVGAARIHKGRKLFVR